MEYSRHTHTEEGLAAVALELHIADVTGVFHSGEEYSLLQGWDRLYRPIPLRSAPASVTNTHNAPDQTNSRACV